MSDIESYDAAADTARGYEVGIRAIRAIKVSAGELPPRTDAERAIVGRRFDPRQAAAWLEGRA